MRNGIRFAAAVVLVAGAGAAVAKEVTVRMVNQGPSGAMAFEPGSVQANVGDTVRFVATDPGHNAEPIAGMIPDGVAMAAGAIGKDTVLTLARPGLYGIKCRPHYAMGMVALIRAGTGAPPNLAAAQAVRLPVLAARRLAPALAAAAR